ncbi:MAG TPA: hypothetical protein VKR06_01850 [Ktedonosporobacter sp.]|nr:hypothetical protein [Ktedonosporobacter sp.]
MKHLTLRRSLLALSTLLLALFVAACSPALGSVAPSPTPTPKPPTPTPTTPPIPTPVPGTTYKGSTYSFNYPQGWTSSGKDPVVFFTSLSTGEVFAVEALPGTASPDTTLNGALNGMKSTTKNAQDVAVPPTITVNNITWSEKAIKADDATGKATEGIILVTQHASGTYLLVYSAPAAQFDQMKTTSLQLILQSFAFTN